MKIYNSHGEYPGQRLKGAERFKRLYHYTSFDTFVKIWLSGKLLFGQVKNVNDLQEADFSISTSNMQHWAVMHKFKELRLSYKQISLCMDYDSYLWGCMSTQMWAYYADKGNGVCIQLDYSKLNIPKTCFHRPIIYKNYANEVTLDKEIATTSDIRRFIKRNRNKLFFTKQFTWKGENEYRIISDIDKSIDISDAITAVYITNSNSITCELLEKLINGKIPIKRIKFNHSSKHNISVPVLTDAIDERRRNLKLLSDPKSNQQTIMEQVLEKLRECENDESASLLMPYLFLNK